MEEEAGGVNRKVEVFCFFLHIRNSQTEFKLNSYSISGLTAEWSQTLR